MQKCADAGISGVGFAGCTETGHEEDGDQAWSCFGFVEEAWATSVFRLLSCY